MPPVLVGSIVCKLHVNAEVFILQPGDNVLKCIAVAARHAYDVTLDRCLDFYLAVLDELDDLFRLLLWNALLNLRALADGAAGGRLNFPVAQGFQWNTAP